MSMSLSLSIHMIIMTDSFGSNVRSLDFNSGSDFFSLPLSLCLSFELCALGSLHSVSVFLSVSVSVSVSVFDCHLLVCHSSTIFFSAVSVRAVAVRRSFLCARSSFFCRFLPAQPFC